MIYLICYLVGFFLFILTDSALCTYNKKKYLPSYSVVGAVVWPALLIIVIFPYIAYKLMVVFPAFLGKKLVEKKDKYY